MSNTAFIGFSLIAILTLAGCKDATSGAESQKSFTSSLNIPGIADEEALKIVGANIHRCEDRYFLLRPGAQSIDELKEPTFDFALNELTQADSLNGISWYATVSLHAPAIRTFAYWGNGEYWSKWVDNGSPVSRSEYVVRNGKFEQASSSASTQVRAFSCSSIPPG